MRQRDENHPSTLVEAQPVLRGYNSPLHIPRQYKYHGRYGGAEEMAVGMEEHARTTLGSVVGAVDIWK